MKIHKCTYPSITCFCTLVFTYRAGGKEISRDDNQVYDVFQDAYLRTNANKHMSYAQGSRNDQMK